MFNSTRVVKVEAYEVEDIVGFVTCEYDRK